VDFSISEEMKEMRRTVKEFVDTEVDAHAQEIEETERVPEHLLRQAKEMGLFGLGIPEVYGGLGLGVLGRCLLMEMIGRTHHGFVSIISAHTGIGSTGLVELGTDAQKEQYLPAMARGEKIGAFALTEPEAGSDTTNLKTTAVRKGDRWILNGTKHFITNGPIADVVTVIAVTDREKGARGGFSAFLVEKGFPGFSVGAVEKKMGLHGSFTSELVFDQCEVPAENLLGTEGRGYASALRILAKGRVVLAARCVGACAKLIELSTSYAQQRIQFGKPIASFQAVQWMLAEMATETAAARALTYQTAWLVDQGMKGAKETSMAKLFATEVFGRVADKAVQIHGGMGYMKDYPIERFYRDARITRIYEGTNEIQRMVVAGSLLKE